MTISFQTLYAIWIGTILGAILLHLVTGDANGYDNSFMFGFMVGATHFAKSKGWIT